MEELLNNPAIQTALVAVIVIMLNSLAAFIKAKFPTQTKLVEANWCYLQPVIEQAVAAAQSAKYGGSLTATAASNIVAVALAKFAQDYRLLEAKDATEKELAASRNEIAAAVSRVAGG